MKSIHTLPMLLMGGIVFFFAIPSHADLVVSVGSVTATPGSAGNAIDVNLSNTGSSAIVLGGFSFGVTVADADITFTEANISTVSAYLFAGDSFFGPVISFPTPTGADLTASDIDLSGAGVTLNAGATVGLGHLLFQVSSAASTGNFTVSLAGWPTTSLSDALGLDVPIDALQNGEITIAQTQSVPEPSTLCLFICSMLFVVGRYSATCLRIGQYRPANSSSLGCRCDGSQPTAICCANCQSLMVQR